MAKDHGSKIKDELKKQAARMSSGKLVDAVRHH
jgi:hypothetical protein